MLKQKGAKRGLGVQFTSFLKCLVVIQEIYGEFIVTDFYDWYTTYSENLMSQMNKSKIQFSQPLYYYYSVLHQVIFTDNKFQLILAIIKTTPNISLVENTLNIPHLKYPTLYESTYEIYTFIQILTLLTKKTKLHSQTLKL